MANRSDIAAMWRLLRLPSTVIYRHLASSSLQDDYSGDFQRSIDRLFLRPAFHGPAFQPSRPLSVEVESAQHGRSSHAR